MALVKRIGRAGGEADKRLLNAVEVKFARDNGDNIGRGACSRVIGRSSHS